MFTVTCDKCGTRMDLDEARVPPSGMVKKCTKCGEPVTVMPPAPGLQLDAFAPAAPKSNPKATTARVAMPPPIPSATRGMGGSAPPPPAAAGKKPTAGPSLAAFEAGLELDEIDLPAPAGKTQSAASRSRAESEVDLPAPVRRGGAAADLPDLLAPVGNFGLDDMAELPAPVNLSGDLPDLLAPVGPVGDLPDLLAPVGPSGGVPDLLAPVGPSGGVPDLLTPVGPSGGLPDLLAPVGAQSRSIDLPAPKGMLDESPLPGRPATSANLNLDSLDLGMPTPPPARGGASMGGGGDALDMLDLSPSGGGGKSSPPSSSDLLSFEPPSGGSGGGGGNSSVLSFAKPSGTAPPPMSSAPSGGAGSAFEPRPSGGASVLDLDTGPAPAKSKEPARPAADKGKDKNKDREQDKATQVIKDDPEAKARGRKRKLIAMVAAAVIVVGGAGGYWFKLHHDEQQEVADRLASGIKEARQLLDASEPDHWARALAAAQRALAVDAKHPEALGLAAQAQIALAIESGQEVKARRAAADELLKRALTSAAIGPDLDRARGLMMVLDGRGADAFAALQKIPGGGSVSGLYLGWAALAAGDAKQAKAAFERALGGPPPKPDGKLEKAKNVAARYGLGRAQAKLGEVGAAQASFDAVLAARSGHVGAWVGKAELIPHDREGTREKRLLEILASPELEKAHPSDVSHAYLLAGREALRGRRWEEAQFRFKKAEAADAANVDALVGRGLALLGQGNVGEARSVIEVARSRDAKNVDAQVALARVALAENRAADAKALMTEAAKARAEDSSVQFIYGKALEAAGDADPALAAYEKAVALDKSNYEAVVALSLLELAKGQQDKALATLSLIEKEAQGDAFLSNTLGVAYLSAGNLDAAERWFRAALTAQAQNVDAMANLATVLERRGDSAAAIAQLEAAHNQDKAREDVAIRLARAYASVKRPADAERVLTALLDDSAGRKPTLAARAAAGRFYARMGNAAKAGAQGEIILAEDPASPSGLFLRGFAALAAGKVADAQRDLSTAITVEPEAQYYEALGRTYEAANQLDDAATAYDNAIGRDKSYVEPRIDRARVRQRRQEWAPALEDLEAAKALAPERAEIWIMSGESLVAIGKRPEAIKSFQQGLALDERSAEGHYKLALAFREVESGDRQREVITHIRRALQLAPEGTAWIPDATFILADTLKSTGNRSEACRAYRSYLEVAPAGAAARRDVEMTVLSCP